MVLHAKVCGRLGDRRHNIVKSPLFGAGFFAFGGKIGALDAEASWWGALPATASGSGWLCPEGYGSGTTTYGYGAGNDLLQTMTVNGTVTQTIGYTADGRMASFSPGIASPGGQLITALNYNQDAQLSVVDAGSTTLASYHCNRFWGNGFEQRVLKASRVARGRFISMGRVECCWRRRISWVLRRLIPSI